MAVAWQAAEVPALRPSPAASASRATAPAASVAVAAAAPRAAAEAAGIPEEAAAASSAASAPAAAAEEVEAPTSIHGMRDTIETPDFNGVPGPFTGSNANNGYVIVGLTVFNYTGTVVEYTIPTTGFYYVAAVGAQGGSGFFTGGFGAGVGGSVFLDMGTELDIVVGGAGATSVNGLLNGGGGGGSFVWDPTAVPPQPVTAAVPEPSTWAMMLLGFGGLGFLGWRGSRKTTARSA
jgi:PEP-CTERM motif